MCVPWELNPRPFALLTQCSTTEPQKHIFKYSIQIFTWFCDLFGYNLVANEKILSTNAVNLYIVKPNVFLELFKYKKINFYEYFNFLI